MKRLPYNKNHYEKLAWAENRVIIGIDEVGRGCLAGPVVTAALILPPGKISRHLKDSKLMTPEERLNAYLWIKKHCIYGIGIAHHRLVDKHNIWHTTLIAMKKALVNLMAIQPYQKPAAILVDAMPLNTLDTSYHDIPVHHFPFGEKKSSSIAAASIVAKVTRDMLMHSYEAAIPGYDLKVHKGYSTPTHKKIVRQRRHSIIHRVSFVNRVIKSETEPNDQGQQTIF